jgi:16S rRNA (cytidine1402-2'-O)-methyltransferase
VARAGAGGSTAPTGRPTGQATHGGRLFIVATPIGNLADVTFRALEVLRTVPLVAAEDTRHSRRLLSPNGITTHLVSFHARNAAVRLPELLTHLRGGADLALITDAGTPGVSDPGDELVRAWAAEGGAVVPVPGASAVLAAVVASGVAGPRWAFEGFLPRSGRERRERLGRIAADERGTVVYEAPGRVAATLADLVEACGGDRPGAVCRELTKMHETIVRGSLSVLAELARSGEIPAKGEFAIVVGAGQGTVARIGSAIDLEGGARAEVERLVVAGVARGDAARRVAAATGISRRKLYGGRAG